MARVWLGAVFAGVCAAFAAPLPAQDAGPVTNLPLPRFVSLNAAEVNLRRGPGLDYRIDWVYRHDGLLVRVIDEYGHWRRIEDSDGDDGWAYHALLSGRRSALVTAEGTLLMREPRGWEAPGKCPELVESDGADGAVACLERGVVARLEACRPGWCRLSVDGHTGWLAKRNFWGAGSGEVFGE